MNLVPADGPLRVEGLPPGRLELGVRPEHLRLGGDGVEARVELVDPVGSEALVHLDAGGTALLARVDAAARPEPGAVVRVHVRPDDAHLFDADTGARVPWR
jgi:multiple sugar transport system ATP-binding protein